MKLVYVFPEPLPLQKARGVQVAWMVTALAKAGVAVDLCHAPSALGTPLDPIDVAAPPGLTLTPVSRALPSPFKRWSSTALFVRRVVKHIEAQKPDAIFVRHLKTAALLLKAVPHIPLYYEAHELFADTTERPSKQRKLAAQEAFVLKHATGVIYISAAARTTIRARYATGAADLVLHSGVEPPAQLQPKNWQDCARNILYTGSFYGWKGVDDLVRAAEELPQCHIKLIGGEQDEIARLSSTPAVLRGTVSMVPKLKPSAIAPHLENACIAVLPNRAGGVSNFTSPLKLFEYMGAGCAIVAADIPSIREILGADDASWFEPGNPQSLAQAIHKLVDNPELARTQAARLREKSSLYTWDARALAVKEFIERTRRSGF